MYLRQAIRRAQSLAKATGEAQVVCRDPLAEAWQHFVVDYRWYAGSTFYGVVVVSSDGSIERED